MTIDEFVKLFPPPKKPVEINDIDWKNAEAKIGSPLPDDYKEFIETYGTVQLGEFLWIFNPFSANSSLNIDAMLYSQNSYEYLKNEFPQNYGRPKFPIEGSFWTWAISDSGEFLFWDVVGNPNTWKTCIHDKSQSEEESFDFGALEFLKKLGLGEIESRILPRSFLEETKAFLPVSSEY